MTNPRGCHQLLGNHKKITCVKEVTSCAILRMLSPVLLLTALTARAGTAALLIGPLSIFKLLPSSSNSRLVLSMAFRVVGKSVWITCSSIYVSL